MHWNSDSRGWEARKGGLRVDEEFFKSNQTLLSRIHGRFVEDKIRILISGQSVVRPQRKFSLKSLSGEEKIIINKGQKYGELSKKER